MTANKELSLDPALDVLFNTLNSVDAQAQVWDQLDSIDHEVFHLEWTGIIDGLMQLLQQRAGQSTPGQHEQWQALLVLVDQK